MAMTEGEIHGARIARLEADVALLRADVGVTQDADTDAMSTTARADIEGSDRLQRTS